MLKVRKLIRQNPEELKGLRLATVEDVRIRQELVEVRVTESGDVSRNMAIFHIRSFTTQKDGDLMIHLGSGGKQKRSAGREDYSLVRFLSNKQPFPSCGYMNIYLVKEK